MREWKGGRLGSDRNGTVECNLFRGGEIGVGGDWGQTVISD